MRNYPSLLDAPIAIRREMLHFGDPEPRIRRVLSWLDKHRRLWDCPLLTPLEREQYDAIHDALRPGLDPTRGGLKVGVYVRPKWMEEG